MSISRRGFLRSLIAGVTLTVVPLARLEHQANVRLVGGFDHSMFGWWVRVVATLEDGREFHDTVQVKGVISSPPYDPITHSVNSVFERTGVNIKPITKQQVIEAFA